MEGRRSDAGEGRVKIGLLPEETPAGATGKAVDPPVSPYDDSMPIDA